MAEAYVPRLKTVYDSQVRAALRKEFAYTNDLQIPKLDKVVLNMGVGEAVSDSRKMKTAVGEMEKIAGQKPVVTKARRSMAGFKLREGMAIGCKVTLRRARMYEFIDRLTTIALPRVKDFRGLSRKSLDGNGNFAMGIREQLVFPEIAYDDIDDIRGMDIVICTTARSDEEARFLLTQCGFPFRN